MAIPDLDTALGRLIDYDLNIYHLEEENDEGEYEYTDQWYVDIYEYLDRDQMHVAGPFMITDNQRDLLQLGTGGYFTDDDSWYGMWGFMADYKGKLLPELLSILQSLPKYKDETLF
jgi:hypothetical protein